MFDIDLENIYINCYSCIIRVINLKIFIIAFFFKLTIAKTLHIKFFSKFQLDSIQVSTISLTEDRKLYKIHFQRFQFQNNKKGERKREGKRREEAKPCTFLNRSRAIGSTQNSLSSKIKDSIRKTSGIPSHLASSTSVRRSVAPIRISSSVRAEIFSKNRNVSILETRTGTPCPMTASFRNF